MRVNQSIPPRARFRAKASKEFLKSPVCCKQRNVSVDGPHFLPGERPLTLANGERPFGRSRRDVAAVFVADAGGRSSQFGHTTLPGAFLCCCCTFYTRREADPSLHKHPVNQNRLAGPKQAEPLRCKKSEKEKSTGSVVNVTCVSFPPWGNYFIRES